MTVANDNNDTSPAGPYGTAAERYFRAGWAPLPIPYGQKAPVPSGWTGGKGAWPSYPDVFAWLEECGDHNIALRLPADILGIDCDNYDAKPGGLVLAQLEHDLGALPATWRTTSRDDGHSGIRLYRIPTGLRWPGGLGPGIDTIRHDHRYAVTWPSTHPAGGTYRWITPDGATALGVVPTPDDLPTLPEAWIAHFTRGELSTDQPHAGLDTATSNAWLTQRGAGTPCNRTQHALAQALTNLTAATSRHDAALAATNRLVWLAGEGHPGAGTALQQLGAAFLQATGRDRADGEAAAEWDRMVLGAVDIAAAAHPRPATDPCTDPFAGLIPPGARPTTPPQETTWTSQNTAPQQPSSETTTVPNAPTVSTSTSTATTPTPGAEVPAGTDATPTATTDLELGEASKEVLTRLRNGAEFILDIPDNVPAIWGSGESVLWASGEALTICGPAGVGKTTLTGQIVRARLVGGEVLGYPVEPTTTRVLYLAMDRPRQIARALRRTLGNIDRATLEQRLVVWPGPPIADVAAHPETLIGLVQLAGADTVVIDSIKDAAVGLSSDEVGAGYNRARQMCIAAGIEVIEQHHMIKKGENGSAPNTLADLYGSVWIGAGAGSVINLHGVAGDPIVSMRHLKTPAEEVGPYRLIHDHDAGTTAIYHQSDLVAIARLSGGRGITAKDAASAVEEKDNPSRSDIEKARRRLDKLADQGLLERVEGQSEGRGGKPTATWLYVPQILDQSNHESNHARDSYVTNHDNHEQSRQGSTTPENQGLSNHESNHGNHGRSNHDPVPPFKGDGSVAGTPLGRWIPLAGGAQEVHTHTKEVRDR